jgi:hypothetical protein
VSCADTISLLYDLYDEQAAFSPRANVLHEVIQVYLSLQTIHDKLSLGQAGNPFDEVDTAHITVLASEFEENSISRLKSYLEDAPDMLAAAEEALSAMREPFEIIGLEVY